MAKSFSPYQNEADCLQLDELTVENRLDRISIYGSIDLWKDKTGLKSARELRHLLDKVITELEKSDLSEKIEIVAAEKVPCPF